MIDWAVSFTFFFLDLSRHTSKLTRWLVGAVRHSCSAWAGQTNTEVSLLVDLLRLNPDVGWIEAARIATKMRTFIHTTMSSILKLVLTAARNDSKLMKVKLLTQRCSAKLAFNVAGAMRSNFGRKPTVLFIALALRMLQCLQSIVL